MQFDPHATKQSKITTQILIAHAMKRCPLQKTLALELNTPDSRISEWKNGKGQMATGTALILIEKFGSPAKAKGVLKNNCRFLPPETSLQHFFNGLVCEQVSRLIAGYITHIRCIVIPDRNNNLEASVEDYVISQLLDDEEFITISKKLLHDHNSKEHHRTAQEDFLLNNSDIELNHALKGQEVSLLSLINKHKLDYLLKEKEYKYLHDKKRPKPLEIITFLAYLSIVINEVKSIPTTILSTWVGKPCYLNTPDNIGGEVVLTGELIHEWYDTTFQGEPILASSETDPAGQVQPLVKHMMQLKTWVNKFEMSMEHSLNRLMIKQKPLYDLHNCKQAFILIKEVQVFHKEESSYLNLAITVSPHDCINEHYKHDDFTLIIEQVTTFRLLEDVIPMLKAIGLEHAITELSTKYKLAMHGLLIPGAISI
ncbi:MULTISPECIES: hypothetical protein [unclassified Shewanella]|uniref:hypothetical protein n=1 Tax=unclassified Shewanella TaxID=196818 RepID=UPI001BC78475|nr:MULTISPECIES: hypothetical protein [unclassified Shewanella]GIU21265.1 hypothetical protein TUM4444_40550 [Shewanella sp. MBTL60-112-B1]GIU33569.1 hypothetical protein TUM4445_20900 [Shewanella sp. MBTL60-112-B2]